MAKKKGADVGERRENERKREAEGMALSKKRDADTGSMGIEMLGGGKEENLRKCCVQVRKGRSHTGEGGEDRSRGGGLSDAGER